MNPAVSCRIEHDSQGYIHPYAPFTSELSYNKSKTYNATSTFAVPTIFVRKKLPPKSPENPILEKAVTNFALSVAILISHDNAMAKAAPAAGPFIIEIVGMGREYNNSDIGVDLAHSILNSGGDGSSPIHVPNRL